MGNVERNFVPECGEGREVTVKYEETEFWPVNRTKWNHITLGKFQQCFEILFYSP